MRSISPQASVQERAYSGQYGYVVSNYQAAYADPISVYAGEPLLFSGKADNWQGSIWLWCSNVQGKSGWVPECYVEKSEQGYRACRDYDARELSVSTGEIVQLLHRESGWFWSRNQHGQRGWVPAENVQVLSALLMDC